MTNNKVIIAAAGSGKTTHLVQEALKVPTTEKVLITTFTESNEAEIRNKFIEAVGHVPKNVQINTWFSVLIEHGIKPFQGAKFEFDVRGMRLQTSQSGFRFRTRTGMPVYWGEEDFEEYYFDAIRQIYSDKLSKLTIRMNEETKGWVLDRIARAGRCLADREPWRIIDSHRFVRVGSSGERCAVFWGVSCHEENLSVLVRRRFVRVGRWAPRARRRFSHAVERRLSRRHSRQPR